MFGLFKQEKEYKDIDAAEYAELMKDKNTVILDVRSPQELGEGFVPGYVMISLFDPSFQAKISKLDKSKAYLVYCRSGNRSKTACSMMANLGFDQLYNLKGGVHAWNRIAS